MIILFNILYHLDQDALLLFCYESVYQIVADIYLKCPERFKQLMGSFDMAKCVRCCIERYVSGGGIEDAFIETKVLGKKMAEQFLNRTHYARSLRAISVSTNAINRQKLEAFWERYDINEYKDLLPLLQAIYENTTVRPPKPCNKTFNLFKEKRTKLQNDFLKFCKIAAESLQYVDV